MWKYQKNETDIVWPEEGLDLSGIIPKDNAVAALNRFVELYERHKNLHIPDTLMDYVAQGVKRWVQGNRDPWPTTTRRKLPHGPVRDAALRVRGSWSRDEAIEWLSHQFEDVSDETLATSLDEQIRNADLLDDYIEETYREK